MSDKTNPNSVWGPNENSAQRINLTRPDASTVGPGGNTVDRARINRSATIIDKSSPSPAFPLGKPDNLG